MTETPNRIDEQFIRDTLQEFMDQYKVKPTELGRVLGYDTKSSSLLAYHGNKFLNGPRPITLEEVGKVADYMKVPITSLLRPTSNSTIHSNGDGNVNVIQTGAGSMGDVSSSSSDEMSDLIAFMKLSQDERETIVQYLKNKQ